jgi:hypothetical protein
MTIRSTAALVTLRALVGGGADVDTPEARRAAIAAVAAIPDEYRKNMLLRLVEASFAAILIAEAAGDGEEEARQDLLDTLNVVEATARHP